MDYSGTIERKRDHYRREIARRTPPRHRHDVFMLEVYRQLLLSLDEPLEIREPTGPFGA